MVAGGEPAVLVAAVFNGVPGVYVKPSYGGYSDLPLACRTEDDIIPDLFYGRLPAATADETPSIAVLPFADMSAKKDQEHFCTGIAEEIINALAATANAVF